jgi:hypothetical protein
MQENDVGFLTCEPIFFARVSFACFFAVTFSADCGQMTQLGSNADVADGGIRKYALGREASASKASGCFLGANPMG